MNWSKPFKIEQKIKDGRVQGKNMNSVAGKQKGPNRHEDQHHQLGRTVIDSWLAYIPFA